MKGQNRNERASTYKRKSGYLRFFPSRFAESPFPTSDRRRCSYFPRQSITAVAGRLALCSTTVFGTPSDLWERRSHKHFRRPLLCCSRSGRLIRCSFRLPTVPLWRSIVLEVDARLCCAGSLSVLSYGEAEEEEEEEREKKNENEIRERDKSRMCEKLFQFTL